MRRWTEPVAFAPARWTDLAGLGRVHEAPLLLRRWFDALRSAPGELLVLEQGDGALGPFLRVRASPRTAPAAEAHATGSPLARRDLGPHVVEHPPRTVSRVFGRLIWNTPTPEEGRGRRLYFSPPPPAGAPVATPTPLSSGDAWAVQALVHAGREGIEAHVRFSATSDRGLQRAWLLLEQVGVAWCAALDGTYQGWAPGSEAHRVADVEWTLRAAHRFHSGMATPVQVEQLTRPWSPPARPTPCPPRPPPPAPPGTEGEGPDHRLAGGNAGVLPLGQSWETGGVLSLPAPTLLRHLAVVGMTGSGKTQLLAHLAASSVVRGIPCVIFDLHGDLGPAVLSRLPPQARLRVEVIDGTMPPDGQGPGLDVLAVDERDPSDREQVYDRLSSEILAALRPLGGGSEEFWGPKMERILDSALRIVLETGGNLYDVARLLQDPVKEGGERLPALRSPELRGFLEQLPAQLRRQPDLLVSSQNRLSKVLLSRTVRRLVAPRGASLDVPGMWERGESLVLHLPKGTLGEGNALYAANLLLARLFHLALRASATQGDERPRVLFVLDEAQGFAPRLLQGIIEEGRKFGAACLFATQSPGRLEQVLGRAPADGVGTFIALRLPPSDAPKVVLSLIGGEPRVAEPAATTGVGGRETLMASLSTLPPHAGWVRDQATGRTSLARFPPPEPTRMNAWKEARERSRRESALRASSLEPYGTRSAPFVEDLADRDLLLRVVRAEHEMAPVDLERPLGRSASVPRPQPARLLASRLELAARAGLLDPSPPREGPSPPRLTERGWGKLGWRELSGAVRESEEHRRLVREAFRLFARRGVLPELPVQGSFQPTPDARVRLWPEGPLFDELSGPEKTALAHAVLGSWVYRLGHGKDLHLEAEVSGCVEPGGLERSWKKAREAGAFLLYLVGSSTHGGRVRRFLREARASPEEAAVWVLRPKAPQGRHH